VLELPAQQRCAEQDPNKYRKAKTQNRGDKNLDISARSSMLSNQCLITPAVFSLLARIKEMAEEAGQYSMGC
jgi:hypothetical protein